MDRDSFLYPVYGLLLLLFLFVLCSLFVIFRFFTNSSQLHKNILEKSKREIQTFSVWGIFLHKFLRTHSPNINITNKILYSSFTCFLTMYLNSITEYIQMVSKYLGKQNKGSITISNLKLDEI